MIPCQRHLFDIPDKITYFNSAYLSPLLKSVAAAGHTGVEMKSRPWEITAPDFFNESERLRERVAELIQARPRDIAIIPSASYGISLAAKNIKLRSGDEIVLLHEQFPSNVYPWQEAARKTGAQLTMVAPDKGQDWISALLDSINSRTRVVAIPNVHWTDGSFIELPAVSHACKQNGASLVLDLSQSLGVIPFSVKEVKPDFVIACAYKWMLGPYGLAYLYANESFQNGTPIDFNWLTRKESENFSGLVNYTDEYQEGARRYDVGERANFILIPMANAALDQIRQWGVSNVQKALSRITSRIAEKAREIGLTVPAQLEKTGHMLGVRFPKGLPPGITESLAQQQIYVSLRGNAMRISPHLHISEQDINKLINALGDCLK